MNQTFNHRIAALALSIAVTSSLLAGLAGLADVQQAAARAQVAQERALSAPSA